MPEFAYASGTLLLFFLAAYTLHKVRRVHLLLHDVRDQTRHDTAGLFRQMEALHGLYVELGLKKSLPQTRGWAASPDFLLELARYARSAHPLSVVECSSGTSTLVLARCMQLNGAGKVLSLEHDAYFARQTRMQLRQHGLEDWAQVVDAPLATQELGGQSWLWYDLSSLPRAFNIDMLVIDGPPQATGEMARYPAGPQLFPRLNAGAHVFLDDAARADETAIVQRWQREFPFLQHTAHGCEKGCAVLSKPESNQV
jgi:predicted O-methyltransferase YrrM